MKAIKYILYISIILVFAVFNGNIYAQQSTQNDEQEKSQGQTQIKEQKQEKQNQEFIDEDGDGYNDNAPDHDGDGIPNGLDPDYQALQKRVRERQREQFIDLDGDGINDNLVGSGESSGPKRFGPSAGTGSEMPSDASQSDGGRQQRKGKGKNN
jgi:hypothetical protein